MFEYGKGKKSGYMIVGGGDVIVRIGGLIMGYLYDPGGIVNLRQ